MKYKSKANMTFRLRDGRRIEPGDEFDVDQTAIPKFMLAYFEEITATEVPVFTSGFLQVEAEKEEIQEIADQGEDTVSTDIVLIEPEAVDYILEAVETAPGWWKLRDKETGELSEKSYRKNEIEDYV